MRLEPPWFHVVQVLRTLFEVRTSSKGKTRKPRYTQQFAGSGTTQFRGSKRAFYVYNLLKLMTFNKHRLNEKHISHFAFRQPRRSGPLQVSSNLALPSPRFVQDQNPGGAPYSMVFSCRTGRLLWVKNILGVRGQSPRPSCPKLENQLKHFIPQDKFSFNTISIRIFS